MRSLIFCAAVIAAQPMALAMEAPADQPAVAAPARDLKATVENVSTALRTAAGVPASDVSVSVHADTLVLSGELATEEEIARTLATAEKAADGARVSSHLKVRPGTQPLQPSVSLVREVEKALRQDQRTANLGVSVSIDDSQVIGLHGLVPSPANRHAAEEVAARVTGVKRVRSHLVVPGE
jgi:osmotically-inducible protein OsmY